MNQNNKIFLKNNLSLAFTVLLLTGCVATPSNPSADESNVSSSTTLVSEDPQVSSSPSVSSETLSSSSSVSSTSSIDSSRETTPSSASESVTYVTITLDTRGGSLIDPITLQLGSTLPPPPSPSKRYHRFQYWYSDNPSTMFNFSTAILQDLTLHASWQIEIAPMSTFNITLDTDITHVTRETYVSGLASLTNHDNNAGGFNQVVTEIRGRGNGSGWGYEQKSYRLKFDKKQGLFGLTPSKHWLLVPGGHDFSLLRAHAAFTLAAIALDNLEFVTSSHYVEVYFNNQYHGVYHLFEHTRVQTGRIDIPSSYDVLDTGYLIEYDSYASGVEGIDYFWVQGLRYAFQLSPQNRMNLTV